MTSFFVFPQNVSFISLQSQIYFFTITDNSPSAKACG